MRFRFEQNRRILCGVGAEVFEEPRKHPLVIVQISVALTEHALEEWLIDGLDDGVKSHVCAIDIQTGVRFTGSGNAHQIHERHCQPFMKHGCILRVVAKYDVLQA